MSISRKPNGRYEVRWRQGDRRLGRTFDRKSDAVAFDLEVRRRQQLGGLLSPDLDVTLREFADEWWQLHVVPDLAAHTQAGYAGLRDRHILPHLGGYRLRELTPRVLNRYRAELLTGGVGQPTVRKALAVLQSMLALAVQEERIDSNPVAKIRKPSQAPSRSVDPIAPAVVERLRVQLTLADATLVSVLAYAGLRPGEALALRWSRIGARALSVERAAALGEEKLTKTGRGRLVRLLDTVREDLADWRSASRFAGPDELVFPRRDGTLWARDDWTNWRRRIFRPAAAAVGLAGARPYDLRMSFVSLLIFEGQTVIEVARQAGHSPETCLRHYARVFAEYDPAARVPAEEQIRRARLTRGRAPDAESAG